MTEIKAESYRLETTDGNWLGQVVITSDGFFGSVTDYGNFSFKWSSIGKQSFKEFILSLNEDYFAKKMAQGVSYTAHNKQIDKSCERFAQEILPVLKKKIQEEIDAEKQETEKPKYLTVETIPEDLDFSNIQLYLNENIFLHYMDLNNWETDNDGNEINRIIDFSFSFYDCNYNVYVRETKLDRDFGSIEMNGDSALFDSFNEAMEDDYWELLVSLSKKYIKHLKEEE